MVGIVKNADGRWVPPGSEKAWKRYASRTNDMLPAITLCKQRRVAVQAGGNIGAWPAWLSKRFGEVLTFEPETVNYQCLIRNIERYKNVEAYNAALGESCGVCELNVVRSIGSHHVKSVTSGATKMMSIDSFGLPVLDYIVLDIEGFEWEALAGARDTIARCKPIIQVEDRGHGVKKGQGKTFGDICNELSSYRIAARVGRDVVFEPK